MHAEKYHSGRSRMSEKIRVASIEVHIDNTRILITSTMRRLQGLQLKSPNTVFDLS